MTAGSGPAVEAGAVAGDGREAAVAVARGGVAPFVGLGMTRVGGGGGGSGVAIDSPLLGGGPSAAVVTGVRAGAETTGTGGRVVARSLSCVSLIVTSQRGPNIAHESIAKKAVPMRASVRRPTMMPTMTCCEEQRRELSERTSFFPRAILRGRTPIKMAPSRAHCMLTVPIAIFASWAGARACSICQTIRPRMTA
jgi:hypothetical protein